MFPAQFRLGYDRRKLNLFPLDRDRLLARGDLPYRLDRPGGRGRSQAFLRRGRLGEPNRGETEDNGAENEFAQYDDDRLTGPSAKNNQKSYFDGLNIFILT